jgi:hypothetical protein
VWGLWGWVRARAGGPYHGVVGRARLARDVLHDGDGALADERDGHRVRAHVLARDAAGGVGGAQPHERDELISTAIRYPSGTSAACCQGDSLDTRLFLRDGGAAGVARLSFARSTEDSRDAITRKTAVLELVRDEDVKKVS